MIKPAPTSAIDPHLARGTLAKIVEPTATKPGYVVVTIPNTSYELHLRPTAEISTEVGKRIIGTIGVDARRIDRVGTGGRYVEPVFGRPRRVQGSVISTEPDRSLVWVNAGVPVALRVTAPNQSASDFERGDLVSCDVLDGATFTPDGGIAAPGE